ncbi:FIST signal transduction protein [Dactylosporangium sp. McL0621]|uniref:FIST signal transduction protein n=1 Tax=Dactylosporangium sp. McL0621 TaxID=3415678 RepID=UPI003CE9C4E8
MHTSRWFAVGQAHASDRRPGIRAAEQALVGSDAKLLLVFCSEALDLPAIIGQIQTRSGGVPLIGCTTAGEIATTGPGDASLLVAALGGDGFSVGTAIARRTSGNLRAAGEHAAGCLTAVEDRPYRVLLLLTDSLAGNQQDIVRGAYSVLGSGVPLVGGCAGDDLKMTGTFQMHGDEVVTQSVVAAGIGSDAPFGIGVRHGWRKLGEPLLVTHSSGNTVYTLDDAPALDVYLERLRVPVPAQPNQEELARLAMRHPLGLSRREGEEQIRFISGGEAAERSLRCIAEVPQGGLVWIMEGNAASVLAATDAACHDSVAGLDGRPPRGMLAFDCIARRGVLGQQGIHAEIGRIVAIAAGAPIAGFYTYGEIARTSGMSGFHNQTLVVLSIA